MEGRARCCESQSGSRALVGVCMCVGGVPVCVCVCVCRWSVCVSVCRRSVCTGAVCRRRGVCVQVRVCRRCVYRCVCRRNTCGWMVAKVVGGVRQAEGAEGAGLQAGSLRKGRSRSRPEGGGHAEKVAGAEAEVPMCGLTMGTLILKATASQSLEGFGSLGWGLTGASRKSITSKVRLSWAWAVDPTGPLGPGYQFGSFILSPH